MTVNDIARLVAEMVGNGDPVARPDRQASLLLASALFDLGFEAAALQLRRGKVGCMRVVESGRCQWNATCEEYSDVFVELGGEIACMCEAHAKRAVGKYYFTCPNCGCLESE